MRKNVAKGNTIQHQRFGNNHTFNSFMRPDQVEQFCILTSQAEEIIKKAFDKLHLSMRGYHKILKVSRTIADLDQSENIDITHIKEAIMYRSLDQYLETTRI